MPPLVSTRTVFSTPVHEGTTWLYSGVLKDENDEVIAPASLSSLTLTLYDKETGVVLNAVQDVNILNTDRGTLSDLGVLKIKFLPADAVIHTSTLKREVHRALIEWTYNGGEDKGAHEVEFTVTDVFQGIPA